LYRVIRGSAAVRTDAGIGKKCARSFSRSDWPVGARHNGIFIIQTNNSAAKLFLTA